MARVEIAGDHLDQRRLARAIVAHQADDLAGFDRQRHVVDRLDGAEMLRDIGEFENRHQPIASQCLAASLFQVAAFTSCSPFLPEATLTGIYPNARAGVNCRIDKKQVFVRRIVTYDSEKSVL